MVRSGQKSINANAAENRELYGALRSRHAYNNLSRPPLRLRGSLCFGAGDPTTTVARAHQPATIMPQRLTFHPSQKSSFIASWIFRPRPALLMTPKVEEPKDAPGAENAGVLVMLKASALNCKRRRSFGINSRWSAKSNSARPGACNTFLPRSPYVYSGCAAKQDVLNHS